MNTNKNESISDKNHKSITNDNKIIEKKNKKEQTKDLTPELTKKEKEKRDHLIEFKRQIHNMTKIDLFEKEIKFGCFVLTRVKDNNEMYEFELLLKKDFNLIENKYNEVQDCDKFKVEYLIENDGEKDMHGKYAYVNKFAFDIFRFLLSELEAVGLSVGFFIEEGHELCRGHCHDIRSPFPPLKNKDITINRVLFTILSFHLLNPQPDIRFNTALFLPYVDRRKQFECFKNNLKDIEMTKFSNNVSIISDDEIEKIKNTNIEKDQLMFTSTCLRTSTKINALHIYETFLILMHGNANKLFNEYRKMREKTDKTHGFYLYNFPILSQFFSQMFDENSESIVQYITIDDIDNNINIKQIKSDIIKQINLLKNDNLNKYLVVIIIEGNVTINCIDTSNVVFRIQHKEILKSLRICEIPQNTPHNTTSKNREYIWCKTKIAEMKNKKKTNKTDNSKQKKGFRPKSKLSKHKFVPKKPPIISTTLNNNYNKKNDDK